MDKISIKEFSVKSKNLSKILYLLNNYGIAKIPNYLDMKKIKSLKKDTINILNSSKTNFIKIRHEHENNKSGQVLIFNPIEAKKNKFNSFYNIFHTKFFYRLCEIYFGARQFNFCEDINITFLKKSDKRILPWHTDRKQTLKFWVYLKKTSTKNGAMEYIPGSHWEGKFKANSYLSKGSNLRNIPNDINPQRIKYNKYTVLEGEPGDLFIFDPDGTHRGGKISSDNRIVVRADTIAKQKAFWSGRFSKFNSYLYPIINKLLHNSGRVIGAKSLNFQGSKRGKLIRKQIY